MDIDKTDPSMIPVVDTTNSLTKDELHELKRLAAMSKAARTLIAMVIGGIMLVGGDKLFDMLRAHQ